MAQQAAAAVAIKVVVTSKEATAAIGRINAALKVMEKAVAAGNVEIVGMTGSFVSLAAAMNKASADGALLAKSLSLIKGMKLQTTLSGLVTVLAKYEVAAGKAGVSTRAFAWALTNLTVTAAAASGALTGLITLLNAAAAAGYAAATGTAAAAGGASKAGAAAGAAAANMGKAGSAAGTAASGMNNAAKAGATLATTTGSVNSGIGKSIAVYDAAAAKGMRFGMVLDSVGGSSGKATAGVNASNAAISDGYARWGKFNDSLWEGSNRLRMAGSQAQWTGRQLAFMFTAPALIMGGIGLKSALAVETQMANLRKVYDGAASDVDKLGRYFEALSNKMGVQQAEVAEIGATWAQAGATGSELANMTKLTTEAMVLGNMNVKDAYTSLIAVQAQYKLSSGYVYDANNKIIGGAFGVKEVLGILNAVENATGASMLDLSQAFERSAATARIAGVDAQHLAAMIATLVPATGSAAKAGVALNSIIAQLSSPDKGAANALSQLGINVEDAAWKSKNLTQRLEDVADAFEGLNAQAKLDVAKPLAGIFQEAKLVQLLGDIANRSGKGLSYYGNALRSSADNAKYMATYQNELNTALNSSPQKLKQAGVIIQNSLTKAIVPLVPHIVHLAQGIAKLTTAFSQMSPESQKMIMYGVAILAAMGPLAMLFGSISILIGTLGKSFAWASRFVRFFAFDILALGTATKVVEGEVVKRSPLIVRAWTAATTMMSRVSEGFWKAMKILYAGGMGILNLIMTIGGKLGLATFTWYQKAQAAVQTRWMAARLALRRTEETAMTATVAAGGRAQTAAAAAGAAGTAGATKRGLGGLFGWVVTLFTAFPGVILKGFNFLKTEIPAIGRQIGIMFMAGFRGNAVAVEGGVLGFINKIVGGAGRLVAGIPGFFRAAGPAILRAIVAWGPRILSAVANIAKIFTGPIGAAIITLISLIFMFPKQIWNAVKSIGAIIAKPFIWGFQQIGKVVSGVGRLISRGFGVIRNIISNVMMDGGIPILAKPFVIGVRIIGQAIAALPKIVGAVFRGIVRMLQRIAAQIREALSYLNPFARHSPSLVDNVTSGMGVVADQYAAASRDIQGSLSGAQSAVDDFSRASAGIRMNADNKKHEETRAKIASADPAAAASYDNLTREMAGLKTQIDGVTKAMEAQQQVIKGLEAQVKAADKAISDMQKELDRLQKAADQVSKSLDAAQKQLDFYANAPITGMRAMSDAIFENEMAQKKLRLEIMKMEDAGKSVDDVSDKFAKLQGEIETLSGQRAELRNAGAGSDITGQYDKMIADLQAQQGALATGGVSEIAAAQKQLEDLQRRGEALDLENSLQFDPLNRQIDQMVNSLQELPFEEKVAGVQKYKDAVAELTVAQEAANKAVEAQQEKIDAATAARDALQERLDAENDKLQALQDQQDSLNKTYDDAQSQIDATTGAIDDINGSLGDTTSGALDAANAVDGLSDSMSALSDGDFEIPGGSFDSDAMQQDIDKMTEDLANQVGHMFDGIDLFGGLKEKWNGFKDWLTGLPGRIGETVSGWGSAVGGWFAGVGEAIGGWFGGLWSNHIWPTLSALPGQLGQFFMDLPTNLVEALSYIVGFIVGFFASLPGRIWDALVSLGDTLSNAFHQAVDYLVQNVPIWIDNVVQFFRDLPGKILDTLVSLGSTIGGAFVGAFNYLRQNIPVWFDATIQWFKDLPGNIVSWIGDIGHAMWDVGTNIVHGLWDGITSLFSGIGDWIKKHMIDPFVNGFKDALGINSPSTVFLDFGKNIVDGLWNGIAGMGSDFKDKFLNWLKDFLPGPVKKFLGIESPSKMFRGFGENIVQGLTNGIAENADKAKAATENLAATVASVDMGKLAVPAVAAAPQAPAAAPAATGAAPANPAAAMPQEMQQTAQGVNAAMAGMDASLQVQLGGIQAQFGVSFTGIHDNVIALTTDMQAQTAATTDQWSLDIQAKHSTLQLNTLTTTTDWSNKINTLTTALKDTATATTQAMVDGQITSFTIGRDGMTQLAADTNANVSAHFNNLAGNLDSTMNGSIRPVMDSFGPMLDQVQSWFGDTVTNVGTQWNGIKEPVAVPARFIVNEVYNNGIKEAWNKVNTFLGVPALEAYTAGFASGGAPGMVPLSSLSNPGKPIDISGGGALKAASSNRDSTLFAGMRGEYVLNKQQVKQWGGISALENWRQNALRGTKPMEGGGMFHVPGFATGGDTRPGAIDEVFKQLAPYKGRAYEYGGGGNPGYDCSGWTGAVHKVLLGQSPQGRIWTTESDFGSFGYKRGKDGYWSIGVHNGGGGMNSHTAGTLDGINFEAGGSHGTSTWGGPAAGTIHPQFENQYYLPSLGGTFQGTAGGGSGPTSQEMLDKAWHEVMDPIKAKIPTGIPGTVGQYPQKGFDKFNNDTYAFLSKKAQEIDAANAAMGNVSYDTSAGVEQWRGVVKEVLAGQNRDLGLDAITLAQMQTESGGNPNAINGWDSNAAAGTPSKGLMQVIDSTFAAYRDTKWKNDIWDPHANIGAALNYVFARYGGPQGVWGQGHGYDAGGVLPPGQTNAVNKTGKPEAILTNSQWNNIGDLIGTISGFTRSFTHDFSLAFKIGFGGIFRRPIKTVPTDNSGKFIGAPGSITGTPNPADLPSVKLDPSGADAFWSSASAQQASWTADLVRPIENLQGVMAGMPRVLGETVVSEWPDTPPPPPVVTMPEIALPPDLAQQIVDAIPTTPVPTVPPAAGGGVGGGAGTGTGTGTGSVPTTPVPTTQVPQAPGGLTPDQQQQLIDMAVEAGVKYAAEHGITLPPELIQFLQSIQVAQTTAANNTSPSTAQSASTQASQATGGGGGGGTTTTQATTTIVVNINGDLSMPNVKGGNDAATFLANLKNLAGV